MNETIITLLDNGKLLKPQKLNISGEIEPYFETIEKDEKGNQFKDTNSEDWLYSLSGFKSKEEYLKSIKRNLTVSDSSTSTTEEKEITCTATAQIWKVNEGRGVQVYIVLDRALPVEQALTVVITYSDGTTKEYKVYNDGRTNLPSPDCEENIYTYSIEGNAAISVGGEDDYSKIYNIMIEEYYKDYTILPSQLETLYYTVYDSSLKSYRINDTYRQNNRALHFTFDEENSKIIAWSDNNMYSMNIIGCVDTDDNLATDANGNTVTIFSKVYKVSNDYTCTSPAGVCGELKTAWEAIAEENNLKFLKISTFMMYTDYYYMIIDTTSENKYKVYNSLANAKEAL